MIDLGLKPMIPEVLRDPDHLEYPVLCTPQVEGMRCLTFGFGVPKDSNLKELENKFIREEIKSYGVEGLDGVLTIPGAISYAAMIEELTDKNSTPDFQYYVWDMHLNRKEMYKERVEKLVKIPRPRPPWLQVLEPVMVYDSEGFMQFWDQCANNNFAGVISRQPGGVYISATSVMQIMTRYEMYKTERAKILGFKEGEPGTLGAWKCKTMRGGVEFELSKGITDKQRKDFWRNRQVHVGDTAVYRHQPHSNDPTPRLPQFLHIER